MADTLETLKEIREINASFPYTNPVREWKEQGKKVIGWACIYVPEEIIYAAGALPIRVTGNSRELDLIYANAYIYTSACSFMRSCFELAFTGQFDFLDGWVPCSACAGIIRLSQVWAHYLKIPIIYMIDVPRKLTERGYEYYLTEVIEFKQRLERFLNVQISEQALMEAILVYNKTRQLLKRLYDLRKGDNPPLSGAETLEVLNAAVRMPKEQYNQLLKNLLEEIGQTKRALPGKIRLMLSGSILNNPEFIRGIEDLGAMVVIDELCTGARYFWDPVSSEPNLAPLEALCRRYFNVFPCARTSPPSVRIDRVVEWAKDFRVAGVITEMVRSCPGVIYDQVLLREKLEDSGVPVYEVDIEYGSAITGQLKTRVEAFLETIGLLV